MPENYKIVPEQLRASCQLGVYLSNRGVVKPVGEAQLSLQDGERPAAPSTAVVDVLENPIFLEEVPARILDHVSQMPGDPSGIAIDGIVTYASIARTEIDERLITASKRFGVTDEAVLEVVEIEMITQLEKSLNANDASIGRLVEALYSEGIDQLTEHDADLLFCYRIGVSSPQEVAETLIRYPVLKSGEIARCTEPFNDSALPALDAVMATQLFLMRQHFLTKNLEAIIVLNKAAATNIRRKVESTTVDRDGETMHIITSVDKQTVASIQVEGFPLLELKRKVSYVGVPAENDVESDEVNIHEHRGERFNFLFIGASYYLTIVAD